VPASLHGTVVIVKNLGTFSLVSVDVGELMVAATVPEGEPDIGTDGWLTPRLSRALLYRSGDGTLVGRETAPAAPAHCCRLRRSPVA